MNIKRLFNSFFWKYDVWYPLCSWFNPRQKWLTKLIPNTWMDKPELIKDILFACLVHYVEEEKGIQNPELYDDDLKAGYISQEYYDSIVTTNTELQEVYDYIKNERPKLESIHQWENTTAMIAHMDLVGSKDMWAMTTIVKHSPCLWT